MQVSVKDIKETAKTALLAHGAVDWVAEEVAKAVARAEETGNIICGLYYLESYCTQLSSGRVKGDVTPEVSCPQPNRVVVDAKFGFAQPAFAKGLGQAVEAARAGGVATLAICHAHTCTSLGYFTETIASHGLIGIGFTNASAIVAPPSGRTPVLGTNPIAMTVPGRGAPVMHADFSTSSVALGKITMAKAAGTQIPLGWAVDKHGKPTTDPAAALGGAIVSAAEHKGWALGLLVETLAAGLTGSAGSTEVKGLKSPDGPPHNLGQFYILIDPKGAELEARFQAISDAMSQDPDARIPGANRRLYDPVEVDAALWDLVLKLANS